LKAKTQVFKNPRKRHFAKKKSARNHRKKEFVQQKKSIALKEKTASF
jgi:hypothetical protein